MSTPKLSVVIPAYNEASGIKEFHETLLTPALKKLSFSEYEVLYVNDGSKDDTLKNLHQIAKKDRKVSVIALSRNFGKEIATTAGLHSANGEAAIVLDADGQHPPALIADFVDKWQKGAQVVVGVRKTNQKEGLVKKWGSKVFYRMLNNKNSLMIPGSTDFRLIDREVLEQFLTFTERNRITRGLIDWLGYERDYIYFDSPARLAGEATYSVKNLATLAVNSMTSLSLRPLFIFAWIGGAITLASALLGLFLIIQQFILGDPLQLNISGAAMLGVFISFMIGLVLISQAILSIYISHIHTQTQDRPLFVVNERESKIKKINK
jgi:dolichol-phosphate mannosyltransferase